MEISLIIKVMMTAGENMTTRIIGTGSALPEFVLTNEDITRFVDTSDEWIRTRTGIEQRHLAKEGESAVSLGISAAKKALENAGKTPQEVELLLVATCSCASFFPSVACQIQDHLGAKNAVAFDLSAACSGFLFALHTAHAYLQAGIYRNALIIGTETLSRVIDWRDRSVCVLFGDGAGACLVEESSQGILAFSQACNGQKGAVLTASAATAATPAAPKGSPMLPLQMNGQEVFKFAVKTVPVSILSLLEKTKTSVEEIQYFLLHQANLRILQSVAKRLGVSMEKLPSNLQLKGNTSAASIPILLDEMHRSGRLRRGKKLILAGFGAGLTWGSTLLEW